MYIGVHCTLNKTQHLCSKINKSVGLKNSTGDKALHSLILLEVTRDVPPKRKKRTPEIVKEICDVE